MANSGAYVFFAGSFNVQAQNVSALGLLCSKYLGGIFHVGSMSCYFLDSQKKGIAAGNNRCIARWSPFATFAKMYGYNTRARLAHIYDAVRSELYRLFCWL